MARIGEELLLRVLLIVTLACNPIRPPISPLSSKPFTPTPPNTTAKQKEGEKRTRTLKLHAYPVGDGLDALRPERLVELGVEADVGGAHRLLSELDDRLDGPGGTLLEGAAVDTLVEVDGVFAGHDILEGGARLAALLLEMMRIQECVRASITGVG